MTKCSPTHTMSITIPLDLTNNNVEYDQVQATIMLAMSLSRMAYEKCICGEVVVTLEKERV